MKDEKERKAAGREASRRQQQQQRRARGNQPLMLGILMLVSGYLWMGRPAFLEPVPPAPVSAELSEASLRLDMTFFITRITKFRDENGRYPTTLAEAWDGQQRPGWVYETRGDSFSLRGLTGGEGIINIGYESTEDVEVFMGDAMLVVAEGAG